MILPLVYLAVMLLALTGITLTTELVVAQEQSAVATSQDRQTADTAVQAYVLSQARAGEAAYAASAQGTSTDQSGSWINGGGALSSYFSSPLTNACPLCSETATASFYLGTPYAGYENLQSAPGVNGNVVVVNTNDPLDLGPNAGGTYVNYSWKINVQATIALTPRGGGPSTTRVDNIMLRVYAQPPYADIVGDDQGANATTLAGDVSTQNGSGVNTDVQAYNVCTDASASGACAGNGTPTNSTIYSYSTTAAAAYQSW